MNLLTICFGLFLSIVCYLLWGLRVNNFQRGDLCGVKFQPTDSNGNPLGSLVAINITGWTGDLQAALYEVTHTGLGGRGTGRIAGRPDWAGTISYDYDADLPPWQAATLKTGQNGFLQFFVTQTKAFQVPIIVEKEHYENPKGLTKIEGATDVKMNAILGPIVYPN